MRTRSSDEIIESFTRRFTELVFEYGPEKNRGLHRLSEITGFSYNRIANWLGGRNVPQIHDLVTLAQATGKSLDWLLGLEFPSRSVMTRISDENIDIDKERDELVKMTERELWMHIRTGSFIYHSESGESLRYAMKTKRVQVRLLISDPNDNSTIRTLGVRRRLKSDNFELIRHEILTTINVLRDFANEAGLPNAVQIMTIPYVPSTVMYISDPDSDNATALVRIESFQGSPREAPVMLVKKALNSQMFDFFYNDYKRLWEFGALDKGPQSTL